MPLAEPGPYSTSSPHIDLSWHDPVDTMSALRCLRHGSSHPDGACLRWPTSPPGFDPYPLMEREGAAMNDITMIPDPRGRWVMMCPCGATEIRAPNGPSWAAFDLRLMEGNRYQITCHSCRHSTQHHMHHSTAGRYKLDKRMS